MSFLFCVFFFFFKQKTAYEMSIGDWSSDVCSSDLGRTQAQARVRGGHGLESHRTAWAERVDGVANEVGIIADAGAQRAQWIGEEPLERFGAHRDAGLTWRIGDSDGSKQTCQPARGGTVGERSRGLHDFAKQH